MQTLTSNPLEMEREKKKNIKMIYIRKEVHIYTTVLIMKIFSVCLVLVLSLFRFEFHYSISCTFLPAKFIPWRLTRLCLFFSVSSKINLEKKNCVERGFERLEIIRCFVWIFYLSVDEIIDRQEYQFYHHLTMRLLSVIFYSTINSAKWTT